MEIVKLSKFIKDLEDDMYLDISIIYKSRSKHMAGKLTCKCVAYKVSELPKTYLNYYVGYAKLEKSIFAYNQNIKFHTDVCMFVDIYQRLCDVDCQNDNDLIDIYE